MEFEQLSLLRNGGSGEQSPRRDHFPSQLSARLSQLGLSIDNRRMLKLSGLRKWEFIRAIRFTAPSFFRTDHSANLYWIFTHRNVPTRYECNIEKHALVTRNDDRTSILGVSTSTKAPFPLERSTHRAASRGFYPSCKVGGEYSFRYCVKPPVGRFSLHPRWWLVTARHGTHGRPFQRSIVGSSSMYLLIYRNQSRSSLLSNIRFFFLKTTFIYQKFQGDK